MVGKTGAALQLSEPAKGQAKKRVRKRKVKRRVELITAYGLFVGMVVALVLLYVAQYAYVAQLNLRLDRAEHQLAEIQALNEQLEQQTSELRSLQRVEHEAVNRLGMQKPEAVRMVRASVEAETVTSGTAERVETAPEADEKPSHLVTFLNWTRGLRRAFAQGVE